jgi:ubiquinone/menaquinone biosynthesis C-methylase UbiE
MNLNNINYSDVTEIPGIFASEEQLSMIMTRYHLAKEHSINKNVLEVACGSGFGLSYLAKFANHITGCDIDISLVNRAKDYSINNDKITIIQADAHCLPFDDSIMDTIIIFEAIYYLTDIQKFINEGLRILKPGGNIIISSVNIEWHGFNPSPYSKKYYSLTDLEDLFNTNKFIDHKSYYAYDNKLEYKNIFIYLLKIIAVKLRLIPKTMTGKKWLKKMFLGKLRKIPEQIYDGLAKIEPLQPKSIIQIPNRKNFKQIYFTIKKV